MPDTRCLTPDIREWVSGIGSQPASDIIDHGLAFFLHRASGIVHPVSSALLLA